LVLSDPASLLFSAAGRKASAKVDLFKPIFVAGKLLATAGWQPALPRI
jgi:hypothetical protein